MKRKLGILYGLLLCVVSIGAQDMQMLQEQQDKVVNLVKNIYIKDLPYPNISITPYSIMNGKYYVVAMENYINDFYGDFGAGYNCVMIFDGARLTQQFCFSGDRVMKVLDKRSFFTIETYRQNRVGEIINTYFTFSIIAGKFYLYQYSKEEALAKRDEEKIENTYIYYRQPRDDPQKHKLIPLDSINDKLLEDLKKDNKIRCLTNTK